MTSSTKVKWYGNMIGKQEVLTHIKQYGESERSAIRELRRLSKEPDSLEKGKQWAYYQQVEREAKQALGTLRKIWNENYAIGS